MQTDKEWIHTDTTKKASFVRETATIEKPVQPRKVALGQYFTPPTVVEFMYQMLLAMMPAKDRRNPRIIDPACGEGIFLKYALENKITIPEKIYGLDLDENVIPRLKEEGLHGKIKFYRQNGLLDTIDGKVSTERKEEIAGGFDTGRFDLVVGNPPYGGIGIKELEKNIPLMTKIRKYELWQKARVEKKHKNEIDFLSSTEQIDLSGNMSSWDVSLKGLPPELRVLKLDEKEKIEKTPIEIFFLERFIQLARPGKWIAIIVPDGILANTQLQYVRDWVLGKCNLKAVISLPRETFKFAGTTAKTSILFLQKRKKDEIIDREMEVFMAVSEYVGVSDPEKNDLPVILEEFKKSLRGKKIMDGHRSPKFMVKISGTPEEFPRIDADYWDPKYTETIKEMKKVGWKVVKLENFIPKGTEGITYGQVGKREYIKSDGIVYLRVTNIVNTGIDFYSDFRMIKKEGWNDPERSRVKKNDLLIVSSGATIGKIAIAPEIDPYFQIVQDIDRVRVMGINPFYVLIFWKSKFGKAQIDRLRTGVGVEHIDFNEICSVQIPLLPESTQKKIEIEYKKMSKFHDKAMGAKEKLIKQGKTNKEAEQNLEYQKNIQKAEEMLKDLIKQIEEIIEGKRNALS